MLCVIGHAVRGNRSGLIVRGDLTQSDGQAERRAAMDMIRPISPGSTRRLTQGADKGFHATEFVAGLRQTCGAPHVARKTGHCAKDSRTNPHEGYALSIRNRRQMEKTVGRAKTVGGMARTVHRGVERGRAAIRGRVARPDERQSWREKGMIVAGSRRPFGGFSGLPEQSASG